MRIKFLSIVFLLSIIFSNSYSQQDVSGWYWLNGQPTGNALRAVKFISSATIYAVGGRGTFMKSTDGGDSWILNSQVGSPDFSSTGNLATRDLNAMWFVNANTGVTGGGTQVAASGVAAGLISRTTDGGNTWTYITYNDTAGTINGFYFINATTGYMCGANRARFFKTTDAGLTWTDLSEPLQNNTYTSVFALDENHIYLTTSLGKIATFLPGQDSAWKIRQLPGTTGSNTIQDLVFKDANTGYACGNANYFAYTVDGGLSWTQSNAPATVGQRDLVYNGGALYMAGSYTEIYKSTNDGVNWTAINFIDGSNVNQPAPFIMNSMDASSGDLIVVGNQGQLNISNDNGATWRNKNYAVTNTLGGIYGSGNFQSIHVESDVTDNVASGKIWVGGNGGGYVLHSTNGGTNWVQQATAHTRSHLGMQFLNSTTGFISGGQATSGVGEMSKTTDGGATWTFLALPSPMNIYQQNNISFVDANTGYSAGFNSPFTPAYIFKTTDGGATWATQVPETAPNGSMVNVQMLDANTGFALGNSLYKTTNGGNNWVKNVDPYVMGTGWSNMQVFNEDIIYLHGGGAAGLKKIIRSTNGGVNWTDITGNLLSTFTVFKTKWLNLKHGVVSGTNGYMAKTTNGGLNWTATNTGGSTTVDVTMPNKNAWYTVGDRNSTFQIYRKYETLTSISVNVTMGIEGFWNGSSMVTDTVTVELHSSTSPFGLVASTREVVTPHGYATYEFNAVSSGSYYIVLKHRNGLETWSAAPVAMTTGGNYNYDFTTAASQAFGNNMILKLGQYNIYSGDVNQDGIIDGSDGAVIDNDAFNFASGYIASDVNGDNIADGSDASIWDNNAANSIVVARP